MSVAPLSPNEASEGRSRPRRAIHSLVFLLKILNMKSQDPDNSRRPVQKSPFITGVERIGTENPQTLPHHRSLSIQSPNQRTDTRLNVAGPPVHTAKISESGRDQGRTIQKLAGPDSSRTDFANPHAALVALLFDAKRRHSGNGRLAQNFNGKSLEQKSRSGRATYETKAFLPNVC